MEWKTWSPLGETPRPDELSRSSPAPAQLMTLSITAYGTSPGDVAINAGHYTTPDGASVSAADRRRIVQAVVQALTDQLELLAAGSDSTPDDLA